MKRPKQLQDESPEIPEGLRYISALINQGEYQKALTKLTDYEDKNPNDKNFQLNKASLLTDIGCGMKDSNLIIKAIDINKKNLLSPLDQKHKTTIHYNLANAYSSCFDLTERLKDEITLIPQSNNLQNAKKHFRQALLATDYPNGNLKKQILVNYGNCLDTLGRTVEALYFYEKALEIDKTFSMAIGNRAQALRFFANISGIYREALYVEAYQAIQSIIDKHDLSDIGGIKAKKAFERELKNIESLFKDKNDLKRQLKHSPYNAVNLTDFERFYIDYCSRENLFLNFHIHDRNCEAAITDPIFIRLLTKASDDDPFYGPYNLAKYINQIKEDYAVARLLLVQSQHKRTDLDNISRRTTFVYCLDYSIFNLYIGLLKSAFKQAYNILDKIAVFINDYYQLGLSEKKIYFTSIWHKEGKIRDEILQSKNISLYALYDIFQDFKSGEFKKIQHIRNTLMHRRLVVFDSSCTCEDGEKDKHNIAYNTLLKNTVDLLLTVKSAIIYLVNFVNSNESRKTTAGEFIPNIHLDTSQFL